MTTYKIGGCLPPSASTYVVRQADLDLEAYLRAGKFCYVLNSRQMGKSSLKLRTMQRLQAAGFVCAEIDLTGIGGGVNEQQWYNSLADELAIQFDLESELETFWDSHSQLSSNRRLEKFIDEILLEQIESKIVVFIDEIDQVLSLDSFTDDFFGLIRSYVERQATNPKYQRLSFVLIGVAVPTDLIENKQQTPLNIGQAIELNGFQLTDDLSPLIQGLVGIVADPSETIAEILYWTNGQPFLTQKICQLVVESPNNSINELIKKNIVDNWEYRDNPVHLKTIANRLLGNPETASFLLQQYRCILTLPEGLDTSNNSEQQKLCLSGLVGRREGKLQVYNPIYSQVFNLDWVDRELTNICPHGKALTDWLNSNRSDTLLLRGEALDEANLWKKVQWEQKKSIGIEGADFLECSQAKRTDRNLIRLAKTIRKRTKILSVLIVVGLVLLFALIWNSYSLKNSSDINQFDRKSDRIISQYEFAPIHSLEAAKGNAIKFQNSQRIFFGQSTPTPKLALQKLVDSIQEIGEIHTYQQGINSVSFCNDDRIFTAGNNGTVKRWNQNHNDKSQEIVNLGAEVKINSLAWDNTDCMNTFASGSSDGSIRLWKLGVNDTQARLTIEQKEAHQKTGDYQEGGVQNVRLVRDKIDKNLYIFSTGKADGRLKKWRVESDNNLKPIWDIPAHEKGIISLNLNGDKDRIGTTSKDNTAKVWDLDGNLILSLTGHLGSVNSISFCSTGSKNCPVAEIATGSNDGTVRLWKADGKFTKQVDAHIGEVRAVRFSPDGKLLATASAKDSTASNGSSVRIWNLEDNKLITEFKGHHGAIESMRFNPNFNPKDSDSRQLATSGYEDSLIRIWKVPQVMPSEHKHQDKINSVRFDPANSQYFITAGEDGKIGWWFYQLGNLPKRIDSFPRDNQQVSFTSIRIHSILGQKVIAVGDSTGMIRLLKIENSKIVEVSHFNTGQGKILSMEWNYKPYRNKSDQYLLATTGRINKNVKIWAIDTKKYRLINPEPVYQNDWHFPDTSLRFSNLSLRFSEDGKNLLIGAEKGQVVLIKDIDRLPDEPKANPLELSKEIESKVTIGFSPDNKSFTIVSHDGEIWRSNIEAKPISEPIQTYQAGTENIAISRDDKIATGGAGAALRLWDLEGNQIADFRGYWGTIRSINFSRDGKYILAGGDDGIPRVWQIDRQIDDLIRQANKWLEN